MKWIGAIILILIASLFVIGEGRTSFDLFPHDDTGWTAFIMIVVTSLVCEYVDSTLGMGYGTIMMPLLLFVGYEPLAIVPSLLLSELLTGVAAASGHQLYGNVNLRPGTKAFRIAFVLGLCSLLGTTVGSLLALRLPKEVLLVVIGAIIALMGLVILVQAHRHALKFSWAKVTFLGIVASFNKGISGGGYGPLVTGGQVLSGVDGKSAIAIASLAESLTCLVGVIVFALKGGVIDWPLMIAIGIGSLLSVPFSVVTVKHMKSKLLTNVIGITTLCMGVLMLFKIS